MSQFVSSVATGWPLLAGSDCRAVSDSYDRSDEFQPAPIVSIQYQNPTFLGIDDFSTDWWPYSGYMLGDTGLSDVKTESWFGQPWANSGCNGRLAYNGTSRDQYGSPLANCTVRLYRVLTGEFITSVLSDANGLYVITTPYFEAHFITVHNSGPPAVAGATVDTLFPA